MADSPVSFVSFDSDKFAKEFGKKGKITPKGSSGKKFIYHIDDKPVYLLGDMELSLIGDKKICLTPIDDLAKNFGKIEESLLKVIEANFKTVFRKEDSYPGKYVAKKYKKRVLDKNGMYVQTLKIDKYDGDLCVWFYKGDDDDPVQGLLPDNFSKHFEVGDKFQCSLEVKGFKLTGQKHIVQVISLAECRLLGEAKKKDDDFSDSSDDSDKSDEE